MVLDLLNIKNCFNSAISEGLSGTDDCKINNKGLSILLIIQGLNYELDKCYTDVEKTTQEYQDKVDAYNEYLTKLCTNGCYE